MAINIILRTNQPTARISVNGGTFLNEPVSARVSSPSRVVLKAKKSGFADIDTAISVTDANDGQTFTLFFTGAPPPPEPPPPEPPPPEPPPPEPPPPEPECEAPAGMHQVLCSNDNVIFLDECGKCWALDEPPPPPPTTKGEIRVNVKNAFGANLGGVRVQANGIIKITTSNGNAVFLDIEANTYLLEVSKDGFVTQSREVIVPSGGFVRAEFALDAFSDPECEDQQGMVKVDCNDPDLIFRDACGQCWKVADQQEPVRKALELTLVPFLPSSLIVLPIAEIFSTIINFLPTGWHIEDILEEPNKITIIFIKEGSPGIVIPPIVIALGALFIIAGIFIVSWKFFDWQTKAVETEATISNNETKEILAAAMEEIIRIILASNLSDEEKANLIEKIIEGDIVGLKTPPDEDKGIDTGILIILALIAVGGLIAYGLTSQRR